MVSLDSPQVHDDYDLIFAGGGTAACTAAGRLAAADHTLKILILEAGPHSKDLPQVNVPGLFFHNLLPTSTTAIFHVANPSKSVNERSVVIPSGRCVGGGSSINWLMYTRGSASDYDAWKNTFGNDGWGSDDILPLLKKSETYQVASDQPAHGYVGPLKVSHGGKATEFGRSMIDMVAKYDADRGLTDDTNDLHTVNKWSRWAKWIDADTGRRSDVASNFIYSQEANQNLVVAAGCRVKRVVFENGRAVGVEYVHDPKSYPLGGPPTLTARAKKLVVISAGALGSPAILERSGIGSLDVLRACDIEQVAELPGVGAEYQDHNLIGHLCILDDSTETLDFAHAGMEENISDAMVAWRTNGSGILSTNAIDIGIKMRPSEKELNGLSQNVREHWKRNYETQPDKGLVWYGASAGLPNSHAGLPPIKIALFGQLLMYPESRGRVHIKSSNVDEPLDFDCGFLDKSIDVEVLRWAYKRSREHARRHPLFRGEIRPSHPNFSADSKAAVMDPPSKPVGLGPEHDIVYSQEDDNAIDDFIRRTVGTTWHSLGTCPMKPREQGGVVDSALNVYGVQGLKVADLSIAPHNIGGNTNSTAILIGEKAAMIIAEELGIKGV